LIHYEELVQNYCDGLFTKLRNFVPGPPFLETWVHDEDHSRSLYGIFEAAESAGLESLEVAVKAETAKSIEMIRLEGELSRLGKVEIKKAEVGFHITVRFRHD
jgi:hypothetical protein